MSRLAQLIGITSHPTSTYIGVTEEDKERARALQEAITGKKETPIHEPRSYETVYPRGDTDYGIRHEPVLSPIRDKQVDIGRPDWSKLTSGYEPYEDTALLGNDWWSYNPYAGVGSREPAAPRATVAIPEGERIDRTTPRTRLPGVGEVQEGVVPQKVLDERYRWSGVEKDNLIRRYGFDPNALSEEEKDQLLATASHGKTGGGQYLADLVASGFEQSLLGTAELAHKIAKPLGGMERVLDQDRSFDPMEVGFFTPLVKSEQARRFTERAEAVEAGDMTVFESVMHQMIDTGVEVGTMLLQIKMLGIAKVPGFAGPLIKSGKSASSLAKIGHAMVNVAPKGVYGFVRTPGEVDDRMKTAGALMLYNITPFVTNSVAKMTGLKGFALDFLFNSAITYGLVYHDLLKEVTDENGNVDWDTFWVAAGPQIATDAVMSWGVRNLPLHKQLQTVKKTYNIKSDREAHKLLEHFRNTGNEIEKAQIAEYMRDPGAKDIRWGYQGPVDARKGPVGARKGPADPTQTKPLSFKEAQARTKQDIDDTLNMYYKAVENLEKLMASQDPVYKAAEREPGSIINGLFNPPTGVQIPKTFLDPLRRVGQRPGRGPLKEGRVDHAQAEINRMRAVSEAHRDTTERTEILRPVEDSIVGQTVRKGDKTYTVLAVEGDMYRVQTEAGKTTRIKIKGTETVRAEEVRPEVREEVRAAETREEAPVREAEPVREVVPTRETDQPLSEPVRAAIAKEVEFTPLQKIISILQKGQKTEVDIAAIDKVPLVSRGDVSRDEVIKGLQDAGIKVTGLVEERPAEGPRETPREVIREEPDVGIERPPEHLTRKQQNEFNELVKIYDKVSDVQGKKEVDIVRNFEEAKEALDRLFYQLPAKDSLSFGQRRDKDSGKTIWALTSHKEDTAKGVDDPQRYITEVVEKYDTMPQGIMGAINYRLAQLRGDTTEDKVQMKMDRFVDSFGARPTDEPHAVQIIQDKVGDLPVKPYVRIEGDNVYIDYGGFKDGGRDKAVLAGTGTAVEEGLRGPTHVRRDQRAVRPGEPFNLEIFASREMALWGRTQLDKAQSELKGPAVGGETTYSTSERVETISRIVEIVDDLYRGSPDHVRYMMDKLINDTGGKHFLNIYTDSREIPDNLVRIIDSVLGTYKPSGEFAGMHVYARHQMLQDVEAIPALKARLWREIIRHESFHANFRHIESATLGYETPKTGKLYSEVFWKGEPEPTQSLQFDIPAARSVFSKINSITKPLVNHMSGLETKSVVGEGLEASLRRHITQNSPAYEWVEPAVRSLNILKSRWSEIYSNFKNNPEWALEKNMQMLDQMALADMTGVGKIGRAAVGFTSAVHHIARLDPGSVSKLPNDIRTMFQNMSAFDPMKASRISQLFVLEAYRELHRLLPGEIHQRYPTNMEIRSSWLSGEESLALWVERSPTDFDRMMDSAHSLFVQKEPVFDKMLQVAQDLPHDRYSRNLQDIRENATYLRNQYKKVLSETERNKVTLQEVFAFLNSRGFELWGSQKDLVFKINMEDPKVPVADKLSYLGYSNIREADMALRAREMGVKGWRSNFKDIDKRQLGRYVKNVMNPESSYDQLVTKALKNLPNKELKVLIDEFRDNAMPLYKSEAQREVKAIMNDLPGPFKDLAGKLMKGIDWRESKHVQNIKAELEPMRKYFEDAKRRGEFVPELTMYRISKIDDKPFSQLSMEEMHDVIGGLRAIAHRARTEGKIRVQGQLREIKEVSTESLNNMRENAAVRRPSESPLRVAPREPKTGLPKRYHDWHLMTDVMARGVEGVNNGYLERVFYRNFQDGDRFERQHYQSAEDYMSPVTRNITGIDKWSGVLEKYDKNIDWKEIKVIDERGNEQSVRLTPAELIDIYNHTKNVSRGGNYEALAEGGFTLDRYPRLGYMRFGPTADEAKVKIGQILSDRSIFTEDMMRVADRMFEFVNTVQKDEMNAVSRRMDGDDVARVFDYWRKQHPREFWGKDYADNMRKYLTHRALEEQSFLQQRAGAKEMPLTIYDAFQKFNETVTDGARYIGLAEPLRTARQVLEYQERTPSKGKTTFKNEMAKLGYLKEYEHFVKATDRAEGAMFRQDDMSKLLKHGVRNVYAAILGLNLDIAIKQPVSMLVAKTEFDTKHWLSGMSSRPGEKVWEKIRQYSPVGRDRERGIIHPEQGEIAQIGEVARFFTGKTPMQHKLTVLIRKMDKLAVGRIWKMVESEVKATQPNLREGTDEYYTAVARRWEDVLAKTQVGGPEYTQSTLRKEMKGQPGELAVNLATMFTSQRNKNYNTVTRSYLRYQESEKTASDKADFVTDLLIVGLAQSFAVTGLTALGQLFRKTRTVEEVVDAKNIAASLFMAALSNLYGVGQAVSIVHSVMDENYNLGFSWSDPLSDTLTTSLHGIGNIGKAVAEWVTEDRYPTGSKAGELKWETTMRRGVRDFIMGASMIKGVPVPNAERYLKAIALHAYPELEFTIDSWFRNPQPVEYYQKVWEGIKKGNTKDVETYLNILYHEFGEPGRGRGKSLEDSLRSSAKTESYEVSREDLREVLEILRKIRIENR